MTSSFVGVDVIFYEGIRTWDEVRYLLKNTPGPCYCIPSRHAGPSPSMKELSEIGQAMSIMQFIFPGLMESWKVLLDVKRAGELAPFEAIMNAHFALEGTGAEEYIGYGGDFVKPSYAEVREIEEKFLPKSQQRNYDMVHD